MICAALKIILGRIGELRGVNIKLCRKKRRAAEEEKALKSQTVKNRWREGERKGEIER